MKLSLNLEADSINVLALNMGRVAVEVDGVQLAELVDVVNDNGYTLTIADTPGSITVTDPLPAIARFSGIQCSAAHITREDNTILHALSQMNESHGDTEWLHFTGSGYLIRLDAWSFPVLQLKRRGLSKSCRRLIVALMCRYSISYIHLDAFALTLPGFVTFDW